MIPRIYICREKRPYHLKKENIKKNYYYIIYTVGYHNSINKYVKKKFSSHKNALKFYSTLI